MPIWMRKLSWLCMKLKTKELGIKQHVSNNTSKPKPPQLLSLSMKAYAYKPPDFPPVPSLNSLIGACSKPFNAIDIQLCKGWPKQAVPKQTRCQKLSPTNNSKQVDWKNFLYIEYSLRCGKKQLDQLSPDTIGLSLNVCVSETINPKPWTKTFI